MADNTSVFTPDTTVDGAGATATGGTIPAVLADASDATYVTMATSQSQRLAVHLAGVGGSFQTPNPFLIKGMLPYVRAVQGVAGQTLSVRVLGDGPHRAVAQTIALTATLTTYNLLSIAGWGRGEAITIDDLQHLIIELFYASATSTPPQIMSAGVSVPYSENLGVAIKPDGVAQSDADLVSNCLTTTGWTFNDPDVTNRLGYELRVYRRPLGLNILSDGPNEQEAFEVSGAGWQSRAASVVSGNPAAGRAQSGYGALQISSTGTADMSADTGPDIRPVITGMALTALARFGAQVTARQVFLQFEWYYRTGSIAGTPTWALATATSPVLVDTVSGPLTLVKLSDVVPFFAGVVVTGVRLIATVRAPGGASERHYLDEVLVAEGDVDTWNRAHYGWPENAGGSFLDVVDLLDEMALTPEYSETGFTDAGYSSPYTLSPGAYGVFVRTLESHTRTWSRWNMKERLVAPMQQAPAPTIDVIPNQDDATVDLLLRPDDGATLTRVDVQRSDDGGITWRPVVGAQGGIPFTAFDRDKAIGKGFLPTKDSFLQLVMEQAPNALWRQEDPIPVANGLMADYTGHGNGGSYQSLSSTFIVGDSALASTDRIAAQPGSLVVPGLARDSDWALHLDGSSSATVPDSPWLDATTGLTLLCWIVPDVIGSAQTLIYKPAVPGAGLSTQAGNYQLSIQADGRLRFAWEDAAGYHAISSTHFLLVGQLYEVAVTFDGTTFNIVVNGVLDSSFNATSLGFTTTLVPTNLPLYLGNSPDASSGFTGAMDEVALWTRALSLDVLATTYLADNHNLVDNTRFVLDSGGMPYGFYGFTAAQASIQLGPPLHPFERRLRVTTTAPTQTVHVAFTPHSDPRDGSPRWLLGERSDLGQPRRYELSFTMRRNSGTVGPQPVVTIVGLGASPDFIVGSGANLNSSEQTFVFSWPASYLAGRNFVDEHGNWLGDIDIAVTLATTGDYIEIGRIMVAEGRDSARYWTNRRLAMVFTDRFAPRGIPVLYRCRTVKVTGAEDTAANNTATYGTVEQASAWTVSAPVTLTEPDASWLRSSSTDAFDLEVLYIGPDRQSVVTQPQAVYWPEGRTRAVAVGGTVRDPLPAVSLQFDNDEQYAKWLQLRSRDEPLFLRAPYGDTGDCFGSAGNGFGDLWFAVGQDVQMSELSDLDMNSSQRRIVAFTAIPVPVPT